MTFRLNILGAAVGATCTVLLAGCSGSSYYMVRQPGAATPYYTTGMERAGNYAVQFKDGRTGSDVALQNSEVTKISKDDYTKGITTPPAQVVGAVTPVPSAATTTVPVVTAVPAAAAPVPSALAPVPDAPAAAGATVPAPQGKPQ
jgi:hypothetical protein